MISRNVSSPPYAASGGTCKSQGLIRARPESSARHGRFDEPSPACEHSRLPGMNGVQRIRRVFCSDAFRSFPSTSSVHRAGPARPRRASACGVRNSSVACAAFSPGVLRPRDGPCPAAPMACRFCRQGRAATDVVDDMEGLSALLPQIDAVRMPRHAEPRQAGFKRLRAGGRPEPGKAVRIQPIRHAAQPVFLIKSFILLSENPVRAVVSIEKYRVEGLFRSRQVLACVGFHYRDAAVSQRPAGKMAD